MGKIKKILENELVGGTQNTDVYPVTSVKAVYDENNERLDNILNRRGVVNISTNYNADHIAEVLTLSQALSKVPSTDRVLGFQGKYLASDSWHTIIYTGDSLTSWSDKTKWIDLADKVFNSISKNATFVGIATPTTNPGTPDGPVFYIATIAGNYSNFGNIEVLKGETSILQWENNTWIKESSGIATEQEIIYDVSARNNGAVFESLQALLSSSSLSTLIPTPVQHGGMSIRFIQGSDNKYVQYRLMADEWSINIDDWAIAEEGVYVENPEFIYVKTDSKNKVLWAIKTDGSIYYGAGIPNQIKEKLDELKNALYDKLVYLEEVESPEWIRVVTDNENKILEGIKGDGSKEINVNTTINGKTNLNGPLNLQGLLTEVTNNPEWLKVITDDEGKIIIGIKSDGKNFRLCNIESEKLYKIIEDYYKGNVNSVQPYCGIRLNNYRTILSTLDNDAANFENGSMGAAQIIKLKDNLYYLYYSAIGEARELSCPLIAYSTDGLNYTRGIPPGFEAPYPGTNHLIFESVVDGTMQPNGVGGWCFFKVNDSEYPFRLFACNGHEDVSGKKREYLWKSADGIRFVQPKLIVDGLFDSTPECIVRGNIIKIYGRMWDEQAPNQKDRYISLTCIDLDGNIISPTRAFMGGTTAEDYYTSGATIIDERREILFPTFINDITQEEELKCFIVDGEHIEKIDVDFSPLISNEDKQWYIRSMFSVGLDLYIVYIANSFSHSITNYSPETGHTEIRIAKIDFLTKGYILNI